jgi:hypothetical protein
MQEISTPSTLCEKGLYSVRALTVYLNQYVAFPQQVGRHGCGEQHARVTAKCASTKNTCTPAGESGIIAFTDTVMGCSSPKAKSNPHSPDARSIFVRSGTNSSGV